MIFYGAREMSGGYFALLSQGLPQLVRISREVVSPAEEKNWRDGAPVVCRIRMINEYPLVPDLEQLESMLFDARDHWA